MIKSCLYSKKDAKYSEVGLESTLNKLTYKWCEDIQFEDGGNKKWALIKNESLHNFNTQKSIRVETELVQYSLHSNELSFFFV